MPVHFESAVTKKRSHKSIKKVKPILMTVGEDVSLNENVLTNALTLVGRFGGHKFNSNSLNGWATVLWKNVISAPPTIFLLLRGWIAFQFSSVDDADQVLAGVWQWDKTGLLIKRWMPLFDPRMKGIIKSQYGLNSLIYLSNSG